MATTDSTPTPGTYGRPKIVIRKPQAMKEPANAGITWHSLL